VTKSATVQYVAEFCWELWENIVDGPNISDIGDIICLAEGNTAVYYCSIAVRKDLLKDTIKNRVIKAIALQRSEWLRACVVLTTRTPDGNFDSKYCQTIYGRRQEGFEAHTLRPG